MLIGLTLYLGFRTLFVRTPWQTFLIATYTTFVGLALEAFVIDTDHWRHFYLLVGIIWGLTAATIDYTARRRREQYLPHDRNSYVRTFAASRLNR